jgi:hypothetical protein
MEMPAAEAEARRGGAMSTSRGARARVLELESEGEWGELCPSGRQGKE